MPSLPPLTTADIIARFGNPGGGLGLLGGAADPTKRPIPASVVKRPKSSETAESAPKERERQYTPDSVLKSQMDMANYFQNLPNAQVVGGGPWASAAGWAGNVGKGFLSTYLPTRAEGKATENERMAAAADKAALSATDTAGITEAYRNGTPDQRRAAVQMMIAEKQRHAPLNEMQRAELARTQAQTQAALRGDEPEVARMLRAAGIDPTSPQGRQIIMNSMKGASPLDQLVADEIAKMRGGQTSAPAPVAPSVPGTPQGQPPALPGRGAGFGPPPAGAGRFAQPQAFEGGSAAPQIIQAQLGPSPQAMPGVPSAAASEPMVDTPVGKMPRDRANILALGYAAQGKGDAAKMFADPERLGKEAGNKNSEEELKATRTLQNLNMIRSSYDPSYLQIPTQVGMWGAQLASKFKTLPPQTQQNLYKYVTFRRDSAANINQAIKDNSGATVTDQELRRNLIELPNAGSGVFDGDDPVTFKAKVDRAHEVLTLGIARTRYLRENGFRGDVNAMSTQLSLDDMRARINARAAQIEAELKQANPDVPKQMLDDAVNARVKQEFKI